MKRGFVNVFLTAICVILVIACSKNEVDPGTPVGTKPVGRDANLPQDLQITGCIMSDFSFDLSTVVGGLSQGFTYTYDDLNRLKTVQGKFADGNKTAVTYTYDKGKISTVFDRPQTAGQGFKGKSVMTLDDKNRIAESLVNVTYYFNGSESSFDLKLTYKYDANGYLIENYEEQSSAGKITSKNTTKYTWTNGNLEKTEVTYGISNNTTKTQITTYSYDTSKVNGTWDGGTAGNSSPYYFLQAGYAGKANKNMLTKIVSETREISTLPILPFDYTLITSTAYAYTYDAKGYPNTIKGDTDVKVSGKLPLGITIPSTVATFTGKIAYKC